MRERVSKGSGSAEEQRSGVCYLQEQLPIAALSLPGDQCWLEPQDQCWLEPLSESAAPPAPRASRPSAAEGLCCCSQESAHSLPCLPEGLLLSYTFPPRLFFFKFPFHFLFFQLLQLTVMHLQDMALLCHYNILVFIVNLL